MSEVQENKLPFISDADFLLMLKSTDWTYAYSDDRRAYESGARQVANMNAAASAMGRYTEAKVYAALSLRPSSEVDMQGIDFSTYPLVGFAIGRKTWGNGPENYSIFIGTTDQRIKFCLGHLIAKVDTSNPIHNEMVPYIIDAELVVQTPFSDHIRSKHPELAERWDAVQGDIFKFTSTAEIFNFLHQTFQV